ncbi:inactivated superfamily I helicase [Malaciobacter marinus]|uniref:Inactivated superfamily I helicase n=1 Tax=Malaciobacter marinus TaxID=505249 RepID=A0AB36ZTJ9_9BACT|nr:PD-(D/E)XK nuclease family protein [Malaciobacter marinus]PPK59616.1 inactivated superfamily I helicase [Malaciobacter marinus]
MQTKQQLIVFPTSRAIREFILNNKQDNSLLPFFLTADDFFKKSFYFNNRKLIDEEQKFLFLKESIKFDEFKKLGISSNFTQFLKQSDYIFRFFTEITSEKVSIEDIKDVDTYEFYKEHLQILEKVKENYEKILDNNDFIDRVNEHKYSQINLEFLNKFSSIEFNFEGYFTKLEFDKILEISKNKELIINLYTNEYNQKSYEIFKTINLDLKQDFFYKLDITNKKILKESKLETKLDSFKIKGFASRVSQIAFIKTAIVEAINKGIEPSNIALILPDENFANKLRLFDDEKYFNYAMGLDVKNSITYKCLYSLNSYLIEKDMKNLDSLEFFNINKELIDFLNSNYNNKISKEKFEYLCDFLISNEINKELKEKLNELFYKLNNLFFTYKSEILYKELLRILLQKVNSISLDDVNSGKITVMGLLESRTVCFDTVIICDFNEQFIPKTSLKDKFLSTKVKEFAKLPTLKDRESLQKYYYKRVIQNCKNLYVSYVSNDTSTISRFASELFDLKKEQSLEDNSYKHILYNKNSLKHFDKKIILDIDLSKLSWSATSLKVYLQCKRKFYLQYILKLKEHEISLKPKGFELGDIVHKILYEYYEEGFDTLERLQALFTKYANKNPFLSLELEVYKKKIENFYEYEKNRIDKIQILQKEMPFNLIYQDIKIKGVIDRVDKEDEDYLVIDYKTSSSLKVDTIKNYEKSCDFQLEFYYLALQNIYKTTNIQSFYYDLNSAKLLKEVALNEKLDLLREIFQTLKTTSVDFEKCEDKSVCNFCIYKTMCNR